jgi:hypothetical protein
MFLPHVLLMAIGALQTGCIARTLVIGSTPSDADVLVNGAAIGQTPLEHKLTWRKETVHTVEVYLKDYDRQKLHLAYGPAKDASSRWTLHFPLERLEYAAQVPVATNPPGATISVDGRTIGTSPMTVPIHYRRSSRGAPWNSPTIRVDLAEHFPAQRDLSYGDAGRYVDAGGRPLHFDLERSTHVVEVRIESTPDGADIVVNGNKVGETPGVVPFRFTRQSARSAWTTAEFSVKSEDYFPVRHVMSYEEALRGSYRVSLDRAAHSLDVRVQTSPPGADISIAGRRAGRTPATVPIRFVRSSPGSAWNRIAVRAELADYLGLNAELTYEVARTGELVLPALVRIRHGLPVNIICNVEGADVAVNDQPIGQSDLTHTFVFERRDADSPWRPFRVRVSKEGYRWRRPAGTAPPGDTSPFSTTLTYEGAQSGELRADLELIRFVWTKLRYLKFEGEQVGIAEELVLAQVGEVETEPMVRSVTRMSDYAPDELMRTRLWVAPPEQQLVYSVPFMRSGTEGQPLNLWRQVGQGLTRLTDGPFADIDASVTADGEYAYFASTRLYPTEWNLWRVQMTGQGGFTKITDSPSSIHDLRPMVSPDGTRVAFASQLRGTAASQIWVANSDGTLPTQLRIGDSPAWSPDGKRLAYVAEDDKLYPQVWVMNADGSGPTQLTFGNAKRETPLWTPDGERIVYVSHEAINAEGLPNPDIWIMNADGTGRTQLTVNGSWDIEPAISPDGRYIYFLSNRGPKQQGIGWLQIWRIELK